MELRSILMDVAYDAGDMLRRGAFDMGEIAMKHPDDPVTNLDRAVETMIRENVLTHMPANFVGEEYGTQDNGADITWIIDPIDGTKSMISGEFNTSLSIALQKGDCLVAGCVYDFMRDIMYFGYDHRLRTYHRGLEISRQPKRAGQLYRIIIDGKDVRGTGLVRRLADSDGAKLIEKNGSIALAMAQVAAGVYDCMIYKTANRWNPWDIAGGCYLLGCVGQVLDMDGAEIDPGRPQEGIIGLGDKAGIGVLRSLTGNYFLPG